MKLGAVWKPETDIERSRKVNTIAETNFIAILQNLHFFSLSSFHLFYFVLLVSFSCLICFLFFLSYCILIFLLSHYSYSKSTLLLVFYFLFRFYSSYLTIIITNPILYFSLVLIHFAIFPNFIVVVVNYIFSHTTPSFYSLLSLFLLHLNLHKCSSFLSQLIFFFLSYKTFISFSSFINSV